MKTRKPYWSPTQENPVSVKRGHMYKVPPRTLRGQNSMGSGIHGNKAPQIVHGGTMAKFAAKLIGSSGTIVTKQGSEETVWVEFLNIGTETWDQDVKLGVESDRHSVFTSSSWLGSARAAGVKGNVQPGERMRFEFTIKIPTDCASGGHKERYGLVKECVTWFPQPEAKWMLDLYIGEPNQIPHAVLKSKTNQLNSAPNADMLEKLNDKKICILSTWNIKCGISQYCRNIYNSLISKEYEVTVFHNGVDYDHMYSFITHLGYSVFIIQYEPAIIRDMSRLIECINKIKRYNRQIKIYLIIHSENKDLQKVDGRVDGFIYHKENTIVFNDTKIYKIPMGVPVFNPQDNKKFYRNKYNIGEDKFVISTVGFMFRWKQHAIFLEKISSYLNQHNDIIIQMMTSFHSLNNQECIDECAKINDAIKKNNLQDKVIHITDYIAQKELNERLFLSDLGFLWSGLETTSSSASLKEFVSSRLPLVKTNSNHHHDINVGCITTEKNMDQFVRKIIEIHNNKKILSSLQEEMNNYYKQINYDQTINNFVDIFNG